MGAGPYAAIALVLIATYLWMGQQSSTVSKAEKLGAGLLLCCNGEVLLLLRAGKHNAGKWGLPGGNADASDRDLLHTASREAEEEMGSCPPFNVRTQVLTQRGKRLQKHFTVFVAGMSPEAKAAFKPQLNEEHSDWRWFPLQELLSGGGSSRGDLHPVMELALQPPHLQAVQAAVQQA